MGREMPDKSVQRVWMLRSCLKPPLTLSFTPLRITRLDAEKTEIEDMRNPFLYMKPRHIRKSIRIVNLATELNWRLSGRILEKLPNLNTVILHAPNLDFAGALAHIDRVIFSHAPLQDPWMDEYFDALPCRPVTGTADARTARGAGAGDERPLCSRKHTRKLVVNMTEADTESPVMSVFTAPLKEVVIILHPWSGRVDIMQARNFDPRQCIIAIAVRGLHVGARVTIVNPEQLDFETGRRTSTFPHYAIVDGVQEDPRMVLRRAIHAHAITMPAPTPEGANVDMDRQFRIIETPTYVKEIGWREFEIEACLRCPTVEHVMMGPGN